MQSATPTTSTLTAAEFLVTDQASFGTAWRYELVDGRIVGHAVPSPDHAAIISGLVAALANRLEPKPNGCRPEAGSGVAPRRQPRPTASIPDVTIRCGGHPRVVFDVVSPAELMDWRACDRKRSDLQDVEDVREIIEIHQAEMAVHAYRKTADGRWSFEALGGPDANLDLPSMDLSIPLAEICRFAPPEETGADAAAS